MQFCPKLRMLFALCLLTTDGTSAIFPSLPTSITANRRWRTAFWSLPTPSLSISSFNSNTIKLYPNPFVNTFKLELEEMNENVSININDLTGKSVYNKTFSELKDLDIQLNMSSGLYVIDVKQNGESRKFKILKK